MVPGAPFQPENGYLGMWNWEKTGARPVPKDQTPEAQKALRAAFDAERRAQGRRLLLMSAHASERLPDVAFHADDVLLMGSESAGVPEAVRDMADIRIRIPMAAGFRSLNIAVSTGIAVAEALRQTGKFPQ